MKLNGRAFSKTLQLFSVLSQGGDMREKKGIASKTFSLMSLILLLSLFSCGKGESSNGNEITSGSIIVGDLSWREIVSLSSSNQIRKNGKAVADIDLPAMGSRCTGFLVAANVLMTNHHCIPTASHARGVTVTFEHEQGINKSAQKRIDCSKFLGNNRELDFALLECEGNPGAEYGVVELSSDEYDAGEAIYVVQQNCDYYSARDCDWSKKYSEGIIKEVKEEYTHTADTLGGSSGSPVFSKNSNKVIAIHHAGMGNNGMGRGYENYAVPMSKIVPYILTNFPAVDLGVGGDSGGTIVPSPKAPNNDTMEGATKASKIPYALKGSISDSKDVDFISFNTNSKSVTVELSFSHSKGDLDLYLVNAQGQVIAKSEGTSSKEAIRKYLPAGKYFALVKGYRGASGSYRLTIK